MVRSPSKQRTVNRIRAKSRNVKYREYNPHQVLQDTVKCFWIHEGNYPTESKQDITPDGCVEVIFSFGDPYLLLSTTPPTPLATGATVGFQNQTMPILLRGTIQVVAARLFAWGVLALLHDNVGAITNAVAALDRDWDSLAERLKPEVTQGHFDAAVTCLQEFLIQRALLRKYDLKL